MSKFLFGTSPTSVILRVKLFDSTVTTGAGKTGLTSASSGLIISTIKAEGATPVTYTQAGSTIETIATLGTYAAPTATKCRFKEVDATNHPGVYEIQLADARFASTGSLLVSVSGVTGLAEADIEVQCSADVTAIAALFTTAQTEAYAADGAAATPAQLLYMIWAMLAEANAAGTTITVKKLDGSTTAMTLTIDSATVPTTITRST